MSTEHPPSDGTFPTGDGQYSLKTKDVVNEVTRSTGRVISMGKSERHCLGFELKRNVWERRNTMWGTRIVDCEECDPRGKKVKNKNKNRENGTEEGTAETSKRRTRLSPTGQVSERSAQETTPRPKKHPSARKVKAPRKPREMEVKDLALGGATEGGATLEDRISEWPQELFNRLVQGERRGNHHAKGCQERR